jgi:threonyl-tRNA synthetase
VTPAEVAADISPSLAKKAISATVNGAHWDLQWPIEADAEIAIHTMKDEAQALELIRHDLAHIMARAVQEIWPDVKVTIGPVIENGWYYDFDRAEPFTPEDLGQIEAKMREIINRRDPVTTEIWDRDRAMKYLRGQQRALQGRADRGDPRAMSRSACTGTAIGRTSAGARICSTPASCPPTPSS